MKQNVFTNNPHLLQEMLVLRTEGWSLPALANRYSVDPTSVQYWCVIKQVERPKVITVRHTRVQVQYDPEPPKRPKTYREYLREYNQRHPEAPLKAPPKVHGFFDLPSNTPNTGLSLGF